jgi:hypothetical protein
MDRPMLKITIQPTKTVRFVDGIKCREWTGTDDKGVPVLCLIRAASPQTDDAAVADRYSREIEDIGHSMEPAINLRNVL